MIMKFNYATFWALALTFNVSDAFLTSPPFGRSSVSSTVVNMVGGWNNDDFLDSLSDDDKEEQARLYREMMENGGAPPPLSKGADLPSTSRFARTDRAGRPLGRNRDADTIANTADLYFAQLKRDSSVRGLARLRGDREVAESVFADEGIKELESLIVENPYLKGLREKEQSFFDTVPEEMLKPFFDAAALPEEERNTSGISYKEMLEQKRRIAAAEQQAVAVPPSIVPPHVAAPPAPAPVIQPSPAPAPIQTMAPPEAGAISQLSTVTVTVPSSLEERKKNIRTLMGMLLKHRGGPGFGKGRLKGGEIDQFESLLQKITAMLREEAAQSTASDPGLAIAEVSQQSMAPPATPLQSSIPPPFPPQQLETPTVPVAPVSPTTPTQFDSTLACIDGAITMYKNSPPELKSSIMVTLRAALASAISGCDAMIGFQDPAPGIAIGQVEGTLGVIEGAVLMYKNSPPELRHSVLFTLRAALKAAVATCDAMSNTQQQPFAAAIPVAPSAVAQPEAQQVAPPAAQMITPQSSSSATDPNSLLLDNIYNKVKAAAGDGSLGLRNDLTSDEASELADQLVEMRGILMKEVEGGIPESNPEMSSQNAQAGESSTTSNYQQMLAKARAAKAGNV